MTLSQILAPLRRLRAMDRDEFRCRLACEVRKRREQAAHAVRPASWNRRGFERVLARDAAARSGELQRCVDAAAAGQWQAAHLALAAHLVRRPPRFPVGPAGGEAVAALIRHRFPGAAADSARRGERVLEGRYDLLGYRELSFGTPPDWHVDPVAGRRPPRGFWASIPYLDPATGDHKVIWELNRHQHWLALGRAWTLTGDRRYYDEFVDQMQGWLAANPPLSGVNWASMLELGFRSISWLWALHLFAGAAGPADRAPWTLDLLLALDRQLEHVEHNLSRYFSPNTHLTGEALALYVAGSSLPELRSSGRWQALGRDVLLQEATRQIHPDGGHAELSAHYHRYSTDFYLLALLVARAAGDAAAPRFEQALARQAEFLRSLADDAGRLPLIGDDDGGQLFPVCGREPADCRDTLAAAAIALNRPDLSTGVVPEEAFWLCGPDAEDGAANTPSPSWPSRVFFDSGYAVSRSGRGDHLVFDTGPHGFLNGGHAHSDALSIVLTLERLPFLVDPGTATYTMEPEVRDLFRSSAMHNTVLVNGLPHARPRGPFHWDSTATAYPLVWRHEAAFDYMEGFHDGYAPAAHTRAVLALHGAGWFIIDHVLGHGQASAETFWHVHPAWRVVPAGHAVVARQRDQVALLVSSTALRILEGHDTPGLHSYAPAYGRIERGTCVTGHAFGPLPMSWLTFVPSGDGREDEVEVEALDVCHSPAPEWHGAAFRVRAGSHEYVILSAADRHPRPLAARSDAARHFGGPAGLWGCALATTDARLALLRRQEGALHPVALVNGARVVSPAGHVASSVHHWPAQCAE